MYYVIPHPLMNYHPAHHLKDRHDRYGILRLHHVPTQRTSAYAINRDLQVVAATACGQASTGEHPLCIDNTPIDLKDLRVYFSPRESYELALYEISETIGPIFHGLKFHEVITQLVH